MGNTAEKNIDAMKFIDSIEDLEYKVMLLDEKHKALYEKEKKEAEAKQTGEAPEEKEDNNIIGPMLRWLKNTSLAVSLYARYEIREWDKKRLSLEDDEKKKFIEILKKIDAGTEVNELSEEEIKLFRLVNMPYPDFFRNYYDKYMELLPEHVRNIVLGDSFPYIVYMAADNTTNKVNTFIKRGAKNENADVRELLMFSLGEYAKFKSINKYNDFISRLVYILRYAPDEVLAENGFAVGSVEEKIDLFNQPINTLLKETSGLINGGHYVSGPVSSKNNKVSMEKGTLMDLYQMVLYKTKGELINTLGVSEAALQDHNVYYVPRQFPLRNSSKSYRNWELHQSCKYYYSLFSEKEKEMIVNFANESNKMPPQKIIALITLYTYMTQDLDEIEQIFNINSQRGYSKTLCEGILDDYNSYVASLEASSYQP